MTQYVLISGASSGIGKAAAIAMANQGLTVFAGALNEREAEAMRAEKVPRLIPVVLDLTNAQSVEAALNTVKSTIGNEHLHGLINCAGVDINAPLHILETSEIMQMINVNYVGAILLTRAVMPLLKHHASRIVFISSAMANMYTPTITIYCSTKSGISGFADSLRVELIPTGIKVSVIEPGVIKTPLVKAAPQILERMLPRMSQTDRNLWEAMMRKLSHMSSNPKAGISTDHTSKAICHAMTAASPRIRYRVGADSKAAGFIAKLPYGFIDWLSRKIYGI
jgi:NAD(P)-dependent dehydrogenase (short-subunit alcohol dehydrogenase family)